MGDKLYFEGAPTFEPSCLCDDCKFQKKFYSNTEEGENLRREFWALRKDK